MPVREEADLGRDLEKVQEVPGGLAQFPVRVEAAVVAGGVDRGYAEAECLLEQFTAGTSPV